MNLPCDPDSELQILKITKFDKLVKSREVRSCHFDRREKSLYFNALQDQDLSLRSR